MNPTHNPFSYLQQLCSSMEVVETFESEESVTIYLAKLKKQHVELIAKSRTAAKTKLEFLDKKSPFRKDLDPVDRLAFQNEYLELSQVHEEAQELLRQFEISNMKILQDFSKQQKHYDAAQEFIASHLRVVTVFSFVKIKIGSESAKFFLYPFNTNATYFDLNGDYSDAISSEAPIGKASLGRTVGEQYSVVLPNGYVADLILEEIKVPTSSELLSLINSWGRAYPTKVISSELDMRENRNHRDRHRTPY